MHRRTKKKQFARQKTGERTVVDHTPSVVLSTSSCNCVKSCRIPAADTWKSCSISTMPTVILNYFQVFSSWHRAEARLAELHCCTEHYIELQRYFTKSNSDQLKPNNNWHCAFHIANQNIKNLCHLIKNSTLARLGEKTTRLTERSSFLVWIICKVQLPRE